MYMTDNLINSNSAHVEYKGLEKGPLTVLVKEVTSRISRMPRVCVSGDQPHAWDPVLGRGSHRGHRGPGRGNSQDRKT